MWKGNRRAELCRAPADRLVSSVPRAGEWQEEINHSRGVVRRNKALPAWAVCTLKAADTAVTAGAVAEWVWVAAALGQGLPGSHTWCPVCHPHYQMLLGTGCICSDKISQGWGGGRSAVLLIPLNPQPLGALLDMKLLQPAVQNCPCHGKDFMRILVSPHSWHPQLVLHLLPPPSYATTCRSIVEVVKRCP